MHSKAGTVIKYTQRGPGTPILVKKIGSDNGQAGAVDFHILAPDDFNVAVTTNLDERQTCRVPRPPK